MSTEHWDCPSCDWSQYGYQPPRECPGCGARVGGTDEEYLEMFRVAEHEAWLAKAGESPMPNMILRLLLGEILRLLRDGRVDEAMTRLEKDTEILQNSP